MNKVFISYGKKDARIAQELCDWLERDGVPCWIAPRDITSGVYAGEITRAVKASDILIVLHSRESADSAHIRNEVNIACNNGKVILPYCLDDSPYDDDMEYYLSSHQRIASSGRPDEDFAQIERIIREKRGEKQNESPAESTDSGRKGRWVFPLLICIIAAVTAALLLFQHSSPDRTVISEQVSEMDLPAVTNEPDMGAETANPAVESATLPSAAVTLDPDADIFTGSIKDGYPDGTGTYTFKKARRIDMHDEEARIAEVGDYIYGNWTIGHLNYGTWYAADGTEKGFIRVGDCPNVELDHQFAKCVH